MKIINKKKMHFRPDKRYISQYLKLGQSSNSVKEAVSSSRQDRRKDDNLIAPSSSQSANFPSQSPTLVQLIYLQVRCKGHLKHPRNQKPIVLPVMYQAHMIVSPYKVNTFLRASFELERNEDCRVQNNWKPSKKRRKWQLNKTCPPKMKLNR